MKTVGRRFPWRALLITALGLGLMSCDDKAIDGNQLDAGGDRGVTAATGSPTLDPFPTLDFMDGQKSVVVELEFSDRFNVDMASASVVRERTHVRAGDPPLLRVQVLDLNGEVLETFNAWHPTWAFVEDDTGREHRILRPGARGSLTSPFRSDAAAMVVTDVAADQEMISVDLLPTTHGFCRDNPLDEDCVDIANRAPVCDADGPYRQECTDSATTVQLDGGGSYDLEGDALTWLWSGAFVGGASATGPDPLVTFAAPGSYSVDLEVTDEFGAAQMCATVVDIVDTLRPDVQCNITGEVTPPHPPVSFTATAADSCDASPSVTITGYDCYTLTRSGIRVDKRNSCKISLDGPTITIEHSGGVGTVIEWTAVATDASGNSTSQNCSLTAGNPGQGNN